MRILITGTTYFPALNGQAIFTVNLAEGLARRGHQVLMVYPSDKGTAYRTERKGVQIEAVQSVSLARFHEGSFFTPFPWQDVRRILDYYQPELVHIHDHYLLSRAFAIQAKRQGIKLVGTNHFMPENLAAYVEWLSRFKRFYNWLSWKWMLEVYNRVDVATAQSKASARLVRAAGLKKPLFAVSCGIDLNRFYPNPSVNRTAILKKYGCDPHKTTILFVGRIDKEKKIDVILQALALLRRTDLQMIVTGQGAVAEDLKALTCKLHLEHQVYFTGYIPSEELPSLLNSVDFFTMPSEAELLSIASLEAMACGRPLLLANAVALPELVDNGVNGYLFEPGNPQDAARCINQLADHPERWPEMGAASLQKARAHSLENVIRKYEHIYELLLSGSAILGEI